MSADKLDKKYDFIVVGSGAGPQAAARQEPIGDETFGARA